MSRNFFIVSPHYPPRLRFFAARLRDRGFSVFGLGDADPGSLDGELRACLTDYCRVDLSCYNGNESLAPERYAAVRSAAEYLAGRYGRPEYLESFNEWWLPLDAALRRDLGVPGVRPESLAPLIRKSLMKEKFRKAGVAAAAGELVSERGAFLDFFERAGRDIVVKPDRGVGASDTFRLRSREEVERFFAARNPAFPYFAEEFIGGPDRELYSFDGLADGDGEPVFFTCHRYSDGIMEVVGGNPLSYHNLKNDEIPEDLKAAGLAALKEFALKKQFFHIEFFKAKGVCLGLEINARPPGVLTLDMINHSRGMDCWDAYARLCAGEEAGVKFTRDMVCSYAARLYGRAYRYSHEDLFYNFGREIVFHMPMDSKVMGDYAYLTLSDTQERRTELLERINEP